VILKYAQKMKLDFVGTTRRTWCVTDVHCAGIEALAPDMVWFVDVERPGMYVSLHKNHFRFEFCLSDTEPDTLTLAQVSVCVCAC
jgi:hypothetical protein